MLNLLQNRTFNDNNYNVSSDSGDESTDIWLSSPSSSHGRSSISSIPWAEDAIKQNAEEWQRIERMFYGEEPLPNNSKIKEEFKEWIRKFPHIRVVGKQVNIVRDTAMKTTLQHDEIIAIDPELKNHTQKPYSNDSSEDLSCQIAKCLRITSGPLLSQRKPLPKHVKEAQKHPDSLHRFGQLSPIIKEEKILRVASVRSELLNKRCLEPNHSGFINEPIILRPLNLPKTLSAAKMPPIYTIRSAKDLDGPINRTTVVYDGLKNQSKLLKSRVTLPSINMVSNSTPFTCELVGRSISAICNNDLHRRMN